MLPISSFKHCVVFTRNGENECLLESTACPSLKPDVFSSIPLDRPKETSVSLTLPKVFVKGSAKSFVTVLGEP